jgi:hypothetical protein
MEGLMRWWYHSGAARAAANGTMSGRARNVIGKVRSVRDSEFTPDANGLPYTTPL